MIAYSNSDRFGANGNGSSSFTVSGSNGLLTVDFFHLDNNVANLSLTYNGVSMTEKVSISLGGNEFLKTYILENPDTGSNLLAWTYGGTTGIVIPIQYTGAKQVQTSFITGSTSAGGSPTSISNAVTTVVDNSVIHAAAYGGYFTSGTNFTRHQGGITTVSGESGSISPAASTTQTINWVGGSEGSTSYIVQLVIEPQVVVTKTASMDFSYAASRTFTAAWIAARSASLSSFNSASRFITASFTQYLTRTASLTFSYAASRFFALTLSKWLTTALNLIAAPYKWLSPNLLNSQKQFTIQPRTQCYIIDNELTFTQSYTPQTYPNMGKVLEAPDGNLIAVGIDSNGFLSFWKKADVTTSWATPTQVIDNGGTFASAIPATISVSEYINGTYSIDIFWCQTSGGNYVVKYAYSDDGGTTWNIDTISTGASAPTTDTPTIGLATAEPLYQFGGTIRRILFYTKQVGGVSYVYFTTRTGGAFATPLNWISRNANSLDYKIHSMDAFRWKGKYNLIVSAYHTIMDSQNADRSASIINYNLYTMTLSLEEFNQVWSLPTEILVSSSSSSLNKNSFTYPRVSIDNGTAYLLFNAVVTEEIRNDTQTYNVGTNTYYYLSTSVNMKDFTYPTTIMSNANTFLTDTKPYSFVRQGTFFFAVGSGKLVQYTENNYIADVTNSLISYTIKELANQTASIVLTIANENGKWQGASPTEIGYQAIAQNKKIVLYQGYNTPTGLEYSPKNIFYIDDIKQDVAANKNDLIIDGRDVQKKFKITTTKFSYNFEGIKYYNDPLDGSTISNWNIKNGQWVMDTTGFRLTTVPTAVDYDVILNKNFLLSSEYTWCMVAKLPDIQVPVISQQFFYIYLMWIDENNYVRAEFSLSGGTSWNRAVYKNINGVRTQIGLTATIPVNTSNNHFPILIRKTGYYTYNIIFGYDGSDGKSINAFSTNPTYAVYDGGTFDLSGIFTNTFTSIGFGCNNYATIITGFFYYQFNDSQNVAELAESVGTKSGILSYKTPTIFEEYFFNLNYQWSNFPVTQNRVATMSASTLSMYLGQTMSTGEIRFKAKMRSLTALTPYSFDLVFRSSSSANSDNCYIWRNMVSYDGANQPFVSSKIVIKSSGVESLLSSSAVETAPGTILNQNLYFDLTKTHDFRIVFNRNSFMGFIDDQLVVAWTDFNVSVNWTDGYFGFQSAASTEVDILQITLPQIWNQIDTLTINAGDDLESSIHNVLTIVKAFDYTDSFGRYSLLLLENSDISTYTYENQIGTNQVNYSDKEYINQVTVIGSGVTAVAKDNALIIEKGIIRDYVITDYKITTYDDALARANKELQNFNKFTTQSSIKLPNNIGSEMFDAVHITNTGNNSADFDQDVRIYSENISMGKGGADYTLEVGTGSK